LTNEEAEQAVTEYFRKNRVYAESDNIIIEDVALGEKDSDPEWLTLKFEEDYACSTT
jgi:hypothetical protein